MKFYTRLILLVAAACLITLSCKKHKIISNNIDASAIFGTWKMVKSGVDRNKNNQPDPEELQESNIGFYNQIMVLNGDQTGSLTYGQEDDTGHVTTIYNTYSWLLVHNFLLFHQTSGDFRYYTLAIHSLSQSELVIEEKLDFHIDSATGWRVYKKQ